MNEEVVFMKFYLYIFKQEAEIVFPMSKCFFLSAYCSASSVALYDI